MWTYANMGTSIVPTSMPSTASGAVTSNFDASMYFECGHDEGGHGARQGNALEFLRSTDLDARNYSTAAPAYRQNQTGGDRGWPRVSHRVLKWFADYQDAADEGIGHGRHLLCRPLRSAAETSARFRLTGGRRPNGSAWAAQPLSALGDARRAVCGGLSHGQDSAIHLVGPGQYICWP